MDNKTDLLQALTRAMCFGSLKDIPTRLAGVVFETLGAQMNFQLMGIVLDASIRALYNADEETFIEIFGDSGTHYWHKFLDGDKQEGAFICSLDPHNLERLARYAYHEHIPQLITKLLEIREALNTEKETK